MLLSSKILQAARSIHLFEIAFIFQKQNKTTKNPTKQNSFMFVFFLMNLNANRVPVEFLQGQQTWSPTSRRGVVSNRNTLPANSVPERPGT